MSWNISVSQHEVQVPWLRKAMGDRHNVSSPDSITGTTALQETLHLSSPQPQSPSALCPSSSWSSAWQQQNGEEATSVRQTLWTSVCSIVQTVVVWRFGGFGVGSEVGPDILIAVGLASKAFLLVLRAHSKHHGSKEKVKSPLDRCKARQGFPETDFDHTTPLHFAVTVKFKPLLGHSRLWAA